MADRLPANCAANPIHTINGDPPCSSAVIFVRFPIAGTHMEPVKVRGSCDGQASLWSAGAARNRTTQGEIIKRQQSSLARARRAGEQTWGERKLNRTTCSRWCLLQHNCPESSFIVTDEKRPDKKKRVFGWFEEVVISGGMIKVFRLIVVQVSHSPTHPRDTDDRLQVRMMSLSS